MHRVLTASIAIFLPLAGIISAAEPNPPPTTSPLQKAFNSNQIEIRHDIPNDSAPPPGLAVNSMEQLNDKQKISIGDKLAFRIVEDREEPRSLSVADSGEVDIPYIGRVMAMDKTCKQLAYDVQPLLEKDYYYHATVLIGLDSITRARGKIYVTGQIRNQGAQEIPNDEVFTVSKAILHAGGFGDFADKRRVKLIRKKSGANKETTTVVVDLVDILEKGKTAKDPVVQPEDLIIVPQRLVNF